MYGLANSEQLVIQLPHLVLYRVYHRRHWIFVWPGVCWLLLCIVLDCEYCITSFLAWLTLTLKQVYFFVIESKDRSLEEIDTMYVTGVNPRTSAKWKPDVKIAASGIAATDSDGEKAASIAEA